jgi:putative transposase
MDRIARIAPSDRLEQQIEELLRKGLGEASEHLAELGRLGARLVLQRAVDEEVAAFLGRARYQRTPTATGSRNGTRPKPIQTAEGEISIAMPQVRNSAERFVSQVIPDTKAVVRTRPLEALIIGGYVRGLSDRDIESLAEEAELGHISKTTVSRICRELRDRYTAFCNKSLADLTVMALFLDAVYLPTRPSGQKEGVLVAWGYTTEGKRVLVAVRLGQRESGGNRPGGGRSSASDVPLDGARPSAIDYSSRSRGLCCERGDLRTRSMARRRPSSAGGSSSSWSRWPGITASLGDAWRFRGPQPDDLPASYTF